MDFVEGLFLLAVSLVIGFVMALLQAALVMWILHESNIAYVSTLNYWQCFGLTLAISVATFNYSPSKD
jgi:hypothetical protein